MATEWIKVEKVTPRKLEVLGVADALGVHPDEAFGLCVRFWIWCDDNLASGNAVRVTSVTLDYALGRQGIADALISVGWLRVRNGSLEVPNFDRHLSQSAKTRALTRQRVANLRGEAKRSGNDDVTLSALPIEEEPSSSSSSGGKSLEVTSSEVLRVCKALSVRQHRQDVTFIASALRATLSTLGQGAWLDAVAKAQACQDEKKRGGCLRETLRKKFKARGQDFEVMLEAGNAPGSVIDEVLHGNIGGADGDG